MNFLVIVDNFLEIPKRAQARLPLPPFFMTIYIENISKKCKITSKKIGNAKKIAQKTKKNE